MERLTKRLEDGQAVMDCSACGVSWHKKREKDIPYCTALFCRNRLKERLASYEDTGLEPDDVRRLQQDWTSLIMTLDEMGGMPHLHELVQSEKDGRLVVLPCKVGDTVYQVDYMTHSEALKSGVPQSKDPYQNRKYARKRAEYLPLIVREKKMVKSLFREFGKTVFLTRAAAEAALAQEGGTNEDSGGL